MNIALGITLQTALFITVLLVLTFGRLNRFTRITLTFVAALDILVLLLLNLVAFVEFLSP